MTKKRNSPVKDMLFDLKMDPYEQRVRPRHVFLTYYTLCMDVAVTFSNSMISSY